MYLTRDLVEAHFRKLGITEFFWFSVSRKHYKDKVNNNSIDLYLHICAYRVWFDTLTWFFS